MDIKFIPRDGQRAAYYIIEGVEASTVLKEFWFDHNDSLILKSKGDTTIIIPKEFLGRALNIINQAYKQNRK